MKTEGTEAGDLLLNSNGMQTAVSRRSLLMLPVLAAAPRLMAQSGSAVMPTGVIGDGVTLNTRALQAAIDRCADAGGGEVVLGPGRYLTGTLHLRDHVTLQLDGGAVIVGSKRLEDYPVVHDAFPSYTSVYTERCLIRADGVSDVAIRGAGMIDGNGAAFAGAYKVRPYMLRFVGCHGVRVEGVTLKDSAMWVQHYLECEDVVIDGVRVRSRRDGVNNDGIDIDSCRRVLISNCDIDCGDDAIVLKATTTSPCRDVVVTNCVLSTLCNAFKLGTESVGGFDNIVFSNSAIYNTRLAGIALETVDGGLLRRVSISNIVMRDVSCPIFLRLGDRGRPVSEGEPRRSIGSFSGVIIRGVIAEANSPVVSSMTGLPGHPIEDVVLEDIDLTVTGTGAAFAADKQVPEKADSYPEMSIFGNLPAYGLYCRHVRSLSLNRIKFHTLKPDVRPALFAEDVEGFSVKALSGPAADNPLMAFRNVQQARVRETRSAVSTQALLHLSGPETEDVAVVSDQEKDPLVTAGPDVTAAAWRLVR